jgi:hypothetical protein
MTAPRMKPSRTSSGPAACAVPKDAIRAIDVRIRFMFIYYSRRYLLSQGLELAIFEVQGHGLLELEHFFGAGPHITDALDSPGLWGLCKDIDMVGLCGLLPHSSFQIDVVFH